MNTRKSAGKIATRKKSVSKAPAAAGREDSRAVKIKRDKEARSRKAQERPTNWGKCTKSASTMSIVGERFIAAKNTTAERLGGGDCPGR